ncbi:type II and III secretion system protein family protein [Fontivita pretiosa]|uniref:type II and III secretion system protein family protein n=1 Tax=Fontivita pretiosa TaxID=2989684 RepID=UPI003D170091
MLSNKSKHMSKTNARAAALIGRGAASVIPLAAILAPGVTLAQDAPATGNVRLEARQTHSVSVQAGHSRVIDAPWPVKRVSISDPSVADVDMTSPRRIQILGKEAGSTEIMLWSEQGEVWQSRVEVEADLSRLEGQLHKMFPDANLEVMQVGKVIVLRGELTRAEQVPQLHRYFELSKLDFIDATKVAGVQQVQLQVKVAEVSRTALRAMGINTLYTGDDFFGGVQLGSSAGPFTPMNIGVPEGYTIGSGPTPYTVAEGGIGVPPTATMFAGFPNSDLQFFIQALAENQYLRVLAEPTLVAMSGQEASFLAGGEFPIPVAQVGGGGTTEISIEYKEFGVRLYFRPTVLGDGRIHLKVTPEVSELSDVGAVEVLGTSVPSVLSRRVETTLEMQSGQTFAIAGLISRSDNARSSKVPGLGDLPVLGPLFRSVRYQQRETELLIMVTASLVEPSSTTGDVALPGDTHVTPNDWELYLDGKIAGKPRPLAPAQAEQLKAMGLNELRGPGGWVSHDDVPSSLAGEGRSGDVK